MKKETILVVDDKRAMRELFAILFEKHGYQVALADGGESAMQRLGKGGIALIITDWKMDKIDGVELGRRVKSEYKIPVVLISVSSSSPHPEDKERAFDFFWRKGGDNTKLIEEIRRLVSLH